MKKIIPYIFIFVVFFLVPLRIQAGNNIYGISLLQPTSEDIAGASALINSKNGDWGYVTLVIQENDRDIRKWQDVFEQLRERHLIPIVRLATSPVGEVWRRPEEKDANDWASFLNRLNWVVKKRYVVLFNEPNHASEWGGEVDPEGYAKVALSFAKTIEKTNGDYTIMLAGLDGAAPSYPPQFEDSENFIRKMFSNKELHLEDYISAWASHSYPNPGFSGSVWDTGKKSIRGYERELDLLSAMGITKDLPVFITETGWEEGRVNEGQIADNYKTAFSDIWSKDPRIQAVTPFVFKYLAQPFVGFSWLKSDRASKQYDAVKEIEKQKGTPDQVDKGSLSAFFPRSLVASSSYHFPVLLKNTGQAIWNDGAYSLSLSSSSNELKVLIPDIIKIKPFEETQLTVTMQTPATPQTLNVQISLKKGGEEIAHTNRHNIIIEPLPQLTVKTKLFPKLVAQGDDFEVQLFNSQEELVFSKRGLPMRKGIIYIDKLSDVIPGEQYRIVLLGYPYIPRQGIMKLSKGNNIITLKQMLPFDANGNGHLDWGDAGEMITHPAFLIRFVPWNQL